MTRPISRRHFLNASVGCAGALATGPLLAQADALPSQQVIVGIMGLNRGMQVAAALEKQPGVFIKYVYRTQRMLKCNPDNGHILDDEEAMSYWQREYEPGWKPTV